MNRLLLGAVVLLTACGKSEIPISVGYVDETCLPTFLALHAELGDGIIVREADGTGVSIQVNADVLEDYMAQEHTLIVGMCTQSGSIYLAPPNVPMPRAKIMLLGSHFKAFMAHELGHAAGLEHRANSIMQETGIPPECLGHEAACLLDALRKGGKIL